MASRPGGGITSMTGFGRSEVSLSSSGRAVVEIHTLNHRFLEVECRLPEGLQGFEESIRKAASKVFKRGRVRVSVALKTHSFKPMVTLDISVARRYVALLRRLKRRLKISGEITLPMLVGLPQVMAPFEKEPSLSRWMPSIRKGISEALGKVIRMRRQEGARLHRVLLRLTGQLKLFHGRIHRRLPKVTEAWRRRTAARIRVLAPALDSQAIAAQAASFIQGGDVSEEMDRIDSHLVALRQALGVPARRSGSRALGVWVESPGRTIDFLAQELHREVNTLGTKVRDGPIVRWVVAMKNRIEKIREQAANIE